MRSKSALAASKKTFLDPANWLHGAPVRAANRATRPRLAIAPRPALDHLVTGQGLTIECLDWRVASERLDNWLALIPECHEPNIFLEPAFALSAAQHFPPANRPEFLFVSETGPGQEPGKLVAIFAIAAQSARRTARLRLWQPPEMPLASPLVHRDHGADVFDAVNNWFAREYPAARSLLYPEMPAEQEIATLLRNQALRNNLEICQFDLRSRAALVKDGTVEARLAQSIGAKRAKELRRQQRRLGDLGELSFETATGDAIRDAMEEFLALEAKGWKGKSGNPMLADPSRATFARTMARRFATRGQCEIHMLRLDGAPIAIGIVLRTGNCAFYWKTAYDETFARFSPGVLLTLSLTERLLDDPAIGRIDSCAMPNHPMIDRLWPDRIAMVDLLVALDAGHGKSFVAAASMEGARRKLRGLAKRTYRQFASRMPS